MRLRIITRPRIHTGLVDLAGVSARSFCGVGFSISGPPTAWVVEDSQEVSFSGISHLDGLALEDIDRIARTLKTQFHGGFSAKLEESPHQHVGLGTKTSLLLALITAVGKVKGLDLSESQIQRMSGRGGASGVGINLFFCGGVVWDGGHAATEDMRFLPSGASVVTKVPPLLARWAFPNRWLVGLVLPTCSTFSGERELEFFSETAPIPADQALETMSAVYHGVIPAFVTADITLLKHSLGKLHTVGFKKEELRAQTRSTIEAFHRIQSLSRVAVGLSSLGPLLYCIFDKRDFESRDMLESMSLGIGAKLLGIFSGFNSGFEVNPA
jgi:beta-ribofuranosylaminobenzene 5'-phosphate synthase